jgi:hypothetical protein
MDNFVATTFKKKRAIVPNLGKLQDITLDKFTEIITKTNINSYFTRDMDYCEVMKECWIWEGTIADSNKGKGHCHGVVWNNNKQVMVHRLMFHNFVADVPIYNCKESGLQVNHLCSHEQNGLCINPSHLYLGTPKQNTHDAIRSGTKVKAPRGETNYKAKLSNVQVEEIKKLKDTGVSQTEVGKKYKVNQSQVSRWWNEKTRTSRNQ